MWQQKGEWGEFEAIDSLGQDLSAILHCPVRYLAYHFEKPVYECRCQKTFPRFAVAGAQESGDWSHIMEHHKNG